MQKKSVVRRSSTIAVILISLVLAESGWSDTALADQKGKKEDPAMKRHADSGSQGVSAGVSGRSRVRLDESHNGSGSSMVSSDGSWSPPACWYEPKFKPKEYKKYLKHAEQYGPHGKGAGIPPEYLKKREKEKYKKGKDGLWWQIVYNDNASASATQGCGSRDAEVWVSDSGSPPADVPVVTSETLSKVAYQSVKLPAPSVTMRPPSGKQVVNFPTDISFDAPLARRWVTASLDFRGTDIAATTVATPSKLRIDAGTDHADPRSCTYTLAKSGSGYQVETGKKGCHLIYRKASVGGPYSLKVQVTWTVHWTATTDPESAPQQPGLPDGTSTHTQDVQVREIQNIN